MKTLYLNKKCVEGLRTLSHHFLILAGIFMALMVLSQRLNAQAITQTIRGSIMDEDTKTPLIGANIIVRGSDPILGGSSDLEGNFRIKEVPVGRTDLLVSYLGYEEKIIPNVLIGSGKEVVLSVTLRESLVNMKEVVVNGDQDKSESINDLALISSRKFTVEETKRYAGSFNDPARMVSGFAGVTTDPSGDNSIVVRGNSPKGIQWRMEGIEIPNPNHFAEEGMTGGSINALNSNMLANSDFFMGAFASEYGNAYSGIFDVNLRNGNDEQREYAVSAGIIGTDITLEGPFSKKGGSSYLVNYRYSTLGILQDMGLTDFDGVPNYQDLSYKMNFKLGEKDRISFFGLGGISHILAKEYEDENEEIVAAEGDFSSYLGVAGLSHSHFFNNKTYLWSNVSFSTNGSGYDELRFNTDPSPLNAFDMNLGKTSLRLASTLNHKFSAKDRLQAGFVLTHYRFDFILKDYIEEDKVMKTQLDEEDGASLYQGFVTWKHRFSERTSLVTGMHYMHFGLNNSYNVEPRLSMEWKANSRHTFTAGFGIHSKLESIINYFGRKQRDDGSFYQPNLDMGFTKSNHYVLGWDWAFNPNTHLKLEAYYQQLYNVPVENSDTSAYSLINSHGWYTTRDLVNDGTGSNIGLEATLERYFVNNFYYMVTASVFDSKYKALDDVTRNTRWNSNYNANVLVGKEFIFGRASRPRTIGINARYSLSGGRWYTPIDIEQSMDKGYEVTEEPFSKKGDDVWQINLAINYRVESKKISQELKLDILNLTDNQVVIDQWYNDATGEIEYGKQLAMIPTFYYTIYF